MLPIYAIFFLILGLVVGSFLNVVISRFNTNRTLGGRSACMSCQTKLNWYELIPLFSFVTLRGRCRSCSSKISLIYPIVELVTGLMFLGLYMKLRDTLFLNPGVFILNYAYYASAFSILIVIAFYDIRHKIIPDRLALVLGVMSFIGLFFWDESGFYIHVPSLFEVLSGLFIALPFAFFWLISKGLWMGLGDAKLALSLGWLIGLSRVLPAAILAFWSGALLGIMLILFSRHHGLKSEIPFAPFLVFGAIMAFIFDLHIFPFF